jgi:LacI family transcriptional regulator
VPVTVTSHDVARLAGVSQPTVSRALRGDVRVAAPTRDRVRKAAAELGYVTSELGRSLATRSTHQIAMVTDLDNALYPTLVGPLHDRFAAHGLRMVLLAERGDDRATYEQMLNRSVDGVVLTTALVGSSVSQALLERGLPFVELNRLSGLDGADGVAADNYAGAVSVARLLVQEGHRRIGMLVGASQTSTGRDREAGFLDALAEAGISVPERWIVRGWFGHDDGRRGLQQVLASGRSRPTAVFCAGGDSVAIGAMNQAAVLGIAVPDDLAVVGFDDLDVAAWPPFQLTTVRVDFNAVAVAGADLLVRRLGGDRKRHPIELFPTELVVRRTHRRPGRRRASMSSETGARGE